MQDHFTYFGFQGCSTVDLVLASQSLLKSLLIQYLSVRDLSLLFDLKPILLKLSNSDLLETSKTQQVTLSKTDHQNTTGIIP